MLNKYAKAIALVMLAISAGVTAHAQSVKGSITLPGQPAQAAVNYLTNKIYVAQPSFGGPADSLAIVDGSTDTVVGSISIPPIAFAVAVDVVRNEIYVGGSFTDANGIQQSEIAAVNGFTKRVDRIVPVTTTNGAGIQSISVDSITGTVFVANASDNVIDVILQGGRTVKTTISVGESPFGVTVNPINCTVYVALSDGTVDVIDGHRYTITTTTPVGTANAGIAVNWTTGNVFVTNNVFGISTVGVLNSAGSVLANVTVGNTPLGIDVDLGTNLAFVANTQNNRVSVIDGKTNTVTATLFVAGQYVTVNPVTQKVYVTGKTNMLTVLNEK